MAEDKALQPHSTSSQVIYMLNNLPFPALQHTHTHTHLPREEAFTNCPAQGSFVVASLLSQGAKSRQEKNNLPLVGQNSTAFLLFLPCNSRFLFIRD